MNNSSKLLNKLGRRLKKSLFDPDSLQQEQQTIDSETDSNNKKEQWLAGLGDPAKIIGIDRETPNAVTLRIAREDEKAFNYRAGQFITLYLFIGSTLYRRSYSISSIPESENSSSTATISITVKEIFDGRISGFFNRDCKVGQPLIVTEPDGEFTLGAMEPASKQRQFESLVYIAAGSGIAPIYGLLQEQFVKTNSAFSTMPATLIYSARREEELIFHRQLEQIALDNLNFKPRYWVTRDKASHYYQPDRLQPETVIEELQANNVDLLKTRFYLCGPSDFTTNLKRELLRFGLAEGAVATEAFVAAASIKSLPLESHPITVKNVGLLGGDKTIVTEPGETVWQAARRNKIKIPTSCRVGGCRTCVVKLAKGQVIMDEPNCLTAAELQEGKVLSCVAYPLEPLEIEKN